MKNRIAWSLIAACAIALTSAVSPAAGQESGQTVKAAIPPQAQPPVAAPAPKTAAPAQRPELMPLIKSSNEFEAANVRLDVVITYQSGNAAPIKRMATLTVADGGRGSLRSGNQVAVTSTTFSPATAGGPGTIPMTSFSYKSVGLNVDANRVSIQGNRVRMDLNVEISAIDEKPADPSGKPPSFPTFSQNLLLILENGKPLIVGQSSDVVDNIERKQSVEVKATILR
jgi:hypothetical protein